MSSASNVVRTSVHALLALAIGAVLAAALHLVAQYLLFLEQVLRIVGTDAVWVGPMRGLLSKPKPGPLDTQVLARLGVLANLLQAGALAVAGYSFGRVLSLRASALNGVWRPVEISRITPITAIAMSAATLVSFALVMKLQLEQAIFMVWRGAQPDAGSVSSSLLAEGISGVLNYPKGGILAGAPQVALAVATCSFAALALVGRADLVRAQQTRANDGPGDDRWLRTQWPTAAFVLLIATVVAALGLVPVWAGALYFFSHLLDAFASLAELPPSDKIPVLLAALDDARPKFELSLTISLAGIALATFLHVLAAVVLPIVRRRSLGTSPPRAANAPWSALTAAVTLSIASAYLWMWSAPYRAENARPLPVFATPRVTLPDASTALPLDGPDALEIAPVLKVAHGEASLDGRPVDARALEADLSTLSRNWKLIYPDEKGPSSLMLLCGSGATMSELMPLLRASHRAGYDRLQFGFGRWRSVERPVMGTMREPTFSAAHATLIEAAASGDARQAPASATTEVFDLADLKTCDDLTSKLVASRKSGRTVQLRLPPP